MNFEVRRIQTGDEVSHPVMSPNGKMLSAKHLEWLAQTPVKRPHRRLQFIACDESVPRRGQPPLRPDTLRWPSQGLQLEFQDSGLRVGIVEDMHLRLPGATQWAQGTHLVATSRLDRTILGDVVWDALQRHVFGGVCVRVAPVSDADGNYIGGDILSIILGAAEGCCLAGCLVLAMWEDTTAQ